MASVKTCQDCGAQYTIPGSSQASYLHSRSTGHRSWKTTKVPDETRRCVYCAAPFGVYHTSTRATCSELCAKRIAAWDRWIADTRDSAARGHVGRELPPAGKTMTVSASRFAQLALAVAS